MDYSFDRSQDVSETDFDITRQPSRPASQRAPLPRLRSEDLFRNGNNELLIEHRGECYRLRLTRLDKLILNK